MGRHPQKQLRMFFTDSRVRHQYGFPMPRTFILTAIPGLLVEGEDTGHLEYVTFVAADGDETHKWFSTNTGTYAIDFAQIVDGATAFSIVQRLRRGETVVFPGAFELHQIKYQFGGAGNA